MWLNLDISAFDRQVRCSIEIRFRTASSAPNLRLEGPLSFRVSEDLRSLGLPCSKALVNNLLRIPKAESQTRPTSRFANRMSSCCVGQQAADKVAASARQPAGPRIAVLERRSGHFFNSEAALCVAYFPHQEATRRLNGSEHQRGPP